MWPPSSSVLAPFYGLYIWIGQHHYMFKILCTCFFLSRPVFLTLGGAFFFVSVYIIFFLIKFVFLREKNE